MNTLLRFEQEGEHLHQIFNSMENTYKAIFNKSYRYFLMLESYENTLYATKKNFVDEYKNKQDKIFESIFLIVYEQLNDIIAARAAMVMQEGLAKECARK